MRTSLDYGFQTALKCVALSTKDVAKIPLEGKIHVENGRILSIEGTLAQTPEELGAFFENVEVLWLRLQDSGSGINTLGKIEMHKTVSGQQCISIVDARGSDGYQKTNKMRGLIIKSHARGSVADFCATFFPPGE
jgi:hypothetical protein